MKALTRFWKRDWINKLIVLLSVGLLAAAGAFVYLVIAMPQGKSLRGAASEMLPWIGTPTPIRRQHQPTLTPAPTSTSEDAGLAPAAILGLGTSFPTAELPSGPTMEPPAASPTFTPTPAALEPLACLEGLKRQEGTVVEVLDGNTVRVLMGDGLVYPVRYTGVDVPAQDRKAEAAWEKNTDLVYGRKVTLYSDASDKDDRGRLLRYVLAGETFANLEIIESGWGSLLSMPPDSSCDAIFMQAEQAAKAAGAGIWIATATPTAH